MRIEGAAAHPAPLIKDAATEPSVNLAALVLGQSGLGTAFAEVHVRPLVMGLP